MKLRERGELAGIRIIGGAALSLRYFDRRLTEDIDAKLYPADAALNAAREVAETNGWPDDWLNSKAEHFIPFAIDPGWESLYDEDGISIWVASAPALLAMKLNASRPGRDDDDIANLLKICEISDIASAEELFETYFPGEVAPDKARTMLSVIFSQALPELPDTPVRPDFS